MLHARSAPSPRAKRLPRSPLAPRPVNGASPRAAGLPDCPMAQAVGLPVTLRLCGAAAIGRLGVSGVLGKDFLSDEDSWHAICLALSDEFHLHTPAACSSWRSAFYGQLWPARGKWATDGQGPSIGFKIQVAARFRPPREQRPDEGRLVLPLHQRLKLLRKGERLQFSGGRRPAEGCAVQAGELGALARAGAELTPELIQAVLEAEQLEAALKTAQRESASKPKLSEFELFPGDSPAAAAAAAAEFQPGPPNEAALAAGGAAGAPAEGAASEGGADEEEKNQEEEEVRPRHSGARLLAIDSPRVLMFTPGSGVRPFSFGGGAVDGTTTQAELYAGAVREPVLAALNGFNGCLLCYGQTGSGKTYTMFGPPGVFERSDEVTPQSGVAVRACAELLHAASGSHSVKLSTRLQYVQIFNDEITDLTSGQRVVLRQAGEPDSPEVVLQGSASHELQSMPQLMNLLRAGEQRKRFGSTAMNDRSSRAHTALVLSLTQVNNDTGAVCQSQLQLVDLAGCEQLKQSKAKGAQKAEAVGINNSLLVLGRCINGLVKQHSHVPYLDSRLTLLLRGALGGNSRTSVLVACSPDQEHADQSFSALQFGERCGNITNSARLKATSVQGALDSIDAALELCAGQLAELESKQRTHLPSYHRVKERMTQLHQSKSLDNSCRLSVLVAERRELDSMKLR